MPSFDSLTSNPVTGVSGSVFASSIQYVSGLNTQSVTSVTTQNPTYVSSVTDYTKLITSEHADKPNFMAMVLGIIQPCVDSINLLQDMPSLYDVDVAEGDALDIDGMWVGVSRQLKVQITNVYFSFDIVGLGFDQGVWEGPANPSSGLTSLPDDFYRVLIKSRILNNHWDGSIVGAYSLMNSVFSVFGYKLFIQDNSDMTMLLGLIGSGPPSPLLQALLTGKYLDVKPAGVGIAGYVTQSQPGPIFAFDISNSYFQGFDTSGWALIN